MFARDIKAAWAAHVVDLMRPWALVEAKPMFGGFGLYREGLMFALIAGDVLYFKTDAETVQGFLQRGLPPFSYQAGDKVATLKYFTAPPEVCDEPEQMALWAEQAWACALRAASSKRGVAGTSRRHRSGVPSVFIELMSIGDKSQKMLAKAGILTVDDLNSLGAVQAYLKVKAACPQASLNLLWALEGAISKRHWQEVARTDRASLLMALEDAQRK